MGDKSPKKRELKKKKEDAKSNIPSSIKTIVAQPELIKKATKKGL